MKLEELIQRAKKEINDKIARYNAIVESLTEARGNGEPDQARIDALLTEKQANAAERAVLHKQLEAYEAELREDQAVARLQSTLSPTGAPADSRDLNRAPTTVTGEARTYAKENDPKGKRFLADVVGYYYGARESVERLSRHMKEESVERGAGFAERAVSAAGSPGLVIPQYLVDLYAAKGRPGRHFADQCRAHDLPETGMTVYIPRQIATTTAGLQAAELDTVAEQDYDDELISVPVRTCAGSQTVSRQWSERGIGTEEIVLEDLLKSCDQSLDDKLLNSASWGLLAVANANTYTDADPTAGEFYRKVQGAVATAEATLLDVDEGDIFTLMRGNRWKWLSAEFTDKWPFIARPNLPTALAGGSSEQNPYSVGIRGYLPDGGAVVTDNNLPANLGVGTNEDVAVAVARQEAHLWEDPAAPFFIRAEQTQSKKLGIDLVVYCYFAAIFDRIVDAQGTPKAVHQKITGTGLVAPVF